jgi:phage terminase small subunit
MVKANEKNNHKLEPRQEKFIQEYLKDLNATQAAIRAGYSAKTANEQGARLLAKASIQAAIDKAQQKRAKRVEVSQDWVIENLKKVFERCMQEEPVNDREGNFTGVFNFKEAGANKALELIGKHLGMFTEKVKISGDEQGIPIQHKVTSQVIHSIDERIAQMIEE